jgi:hypothetical protein
MSQLTACQFPQLSNELPVNVRERSLANIMQNQAISLAGDETSCRKWRITMQIKHAAEKSIHHTRLPIKLNGNLQNSLSSG